MSVLIRETFMQIEMCSLADKRLYDWMYKFKFIFYIFIR